LAINALTAFKISSPLSIATSWIIDVLHTGAGGTSYFADLSQGMSVTFSMITKTVFHITNSLQSFFASLFIPSTPSTETPPGGPSFPVPPTNPDFDIFITKIEPSHITVPAENETGTFNATITIINNGATTEITLRSWIENQYGVTVHNQTSRMLLVSKENRTLTLTFPIPKQAGEYWLKLEIPYITPVPMASATFTVHAGEQTAIPVVLAIACVAVGAGVAYNMGKRHKKKKKQHAKWPKPKLWT